MSAMIKLRSVASINRQKMPLRRLLHAAFGAIAIAGGTTSTLAADIQQFENIRAVDTQLGDIGYRLAVANATLCDRQEPGLGLLLHTPTQYAPGVREEAIKHFHFDGPAGVEAVLPGSPAAAAGVKADDAVLGAGPARFDAADLSGDAGTTALIRLTGQIAALPAGEPVKLNVRRNGTERVVAVHSVPACRTRFEVAVGADFVARADGEMVQIGSRFFADYPDLVAAPIAHELAHNILHHRDRLEAKGVDYGLLSGFGSNVAYFRQTELEADILSVSLLANAGYDPTIAVRFWQAFGPKHAGGPLRSRSHPGWKDRVATIQRAIGELGASRPNRPAILADRDKPLDGDWQKLLVTAR